MRGQVWKFGDGIDTDLLAPGAYMKGPIEDMARHCLEAISPDFAGAVQPGDVIVAGRNFGAGSSREQAAGVLRVLGVQAVIAKSFSGIFYRNAFNLGLPAIVSESVDAIGHGELVKIDLLGGRVHNVTRNEILKIQPVPDHLVDLVRSGGLIQYLKQKLEHMNGANSQCNP